MWITAKSWPGVWIAAAGAADTVGTMIPPAAFEPSWTGAAWITGCCMTFTVAPLIPTATAVAAPGVAWWWLAKVTFWR